MSPPTWPDNSTSAAVDRRVWKAARRSVLMQCDRCLCKGSGNLNYRGRIVSVSLAASLVGGQWTHNGCNGRLTAYDIEVSR